MGAVAAKALKSWEYPKKSGVRVREIFNATAGAAFGVSYLVTVPSRLTGGLRERRQFKDRGDALDWADKQFTGYRKDGEGFFTLTDAERREIGACLPALKAHGISLTEAVRFAVKRLRPEGRTKSVHDLVSELVASKTQRFGRGDLRERSYEDFKQRAERFAVTFGGRIASEVSGQEIKTWLNGLEVGVRSNKNYLSVIGELFKLAVQRRYAAFSPLEDLTDSDRKELCGGTSGAKEPSILTPAQAESMLLAAAAHPELEMLGPVALALFCGLRTEEIKRLEWEQVRLSDVPPVVTVGAKIAKKRRIRHVEIPANAIPWLSSVRNRAGLVAKCEDRHAYRRRFDRLLKFAGFKEWEANAMRHSFGSYHYALHGNPLETSRLLGHKASDQVLFDHYRALASKADAEAYFAIRPPAETGKIVRFG